jgi:hypothetical protein
MQRREFITLLGGASAAWPLAVRAQQPARMKRIAIVSPATKVSEISVSGRPYYRAFFEELSRLGYVEGQNLGVERYSGEGRSERYAELVRDVVNTHPDLILTAANRLSLDFKMATTTIPIVTITADPVAIGLAASIARPGAVALAVLAPRTTIVERPQSIRTIRKLRATSTLMTIRAWDKPVRPGAALDGNVDCQGSPHRRVAHHPIAHPFLVILRQTPSGHLRPHQLEGKLALRTIGQIAVNAGEVAR